MSDTAKQMFWIEISRNQDPLKIEATIVADLGIRDGWRRLVIEYQDELGFLFRRALLQPLALPGPSIPIDDVPAVHANDFFDQLSEASSPRLMTRQ